MEREEGVVAWNSADGRALGEVAAGLLGSGSGEVHVQDPGNTRVMFGFPASRKPHLSKGEGERVKLHTLPQN